MRFQNKIAVVVGFALLAIACTHQRVPSGQTQAPIKVGAQAPLFTLSSAGGGTVSLSDYAGKPVLLYFSMGPG